MQNINDSSDMEQERLWSLFEHYNDIERWEQALRVIESLLSLDINNYNYHFNRARVLYALDQYDDALDELHNAVELGYTGIQHNFEAMIHWRKRDFFKADECFIRSVEENPNDAHVYSCYADFMMFTGCIDKANLLIDKALELEPSNSTANFLKLLFQSTTNKKNFETFFNERLMEISNEEVDKLFHLGFNEYLSKKYKPAKDLMRQAFTLEPTNKRLSWMMHVLEYKTSNFYMPNRILEMTGGHIVWWMIFIVQVLVLRYFKYYTAAWCISFAFILIFLYIELSYMLYNIYISRKGVI